MSAHFVDKSYELIRSFFLSLEDDDFSEEERRWRRSKVAKFKTDFNKNKSQLLARFREGCRNIYVVKIGSSYMAHFLRYQGEKTFFLFLFKTLSKIFSW